jgi:hypothetical protein
VVVPSTGAWWWVSGDSALRGGGGIGPPSPFLTRASSSWIKVPADATFAKYSLIFSLHVTKTPISALVYHDVLEKSREQYIFTALPRSESEKCVFFIPRMLNWHISYSILAQNKSEKRVCSSPRDSAALLHRDEMQTDLSC